MKENIVYLKINSFIGRSLGAKHYYGKLTSDFGEEYESHDLVKELTAGEAKRLSIDHDWDFVKGSIHGSMKTKNVVREVAKEIWLDIFPDATILLEGNPIYPDSEFLELARIEEIMGNPGEETHIGWDMTDNKMKVKLRMSIPVAKEHKLLEGMEIELVEGKIKIDTGKVNVKGEREQYWVDGWWTKSPIEWVKILPHEYMHLD